MKNPYEVLGIDKNNFDEKELKKKYKKLCVKYHPDKFATKSEEEQKEAEEMFKEINEAYQVLSDPDKKRQYDQFGDVNARTAHHQEQPFGGMWEHIRRAQKQAREREMAGADIRMRIPLTLKELYNGTKKKLRFKRHVRCSKCHGAGGSGQESCPHCEGTGILVESYRNGNTIFQSQTTCPHCQGTGIFTKYKCEKCNGTGFEIEYNIVEVEFPAGLQEGETIVVYNEGSQSSKSQYPNGNFVCIINQEYNPDKYVLNGLDIFEYVSVPYYKALLGEEIDIDHPNQGPMKVKLDECTQPDSRKVIKHKGLPREGYQTGDYIIVVNYEIPTKLSQKEKETLKKLL